MNQTAPLEQSASARTVRPNSQAASSCAYRSGLRVAHFGRRVEHKCPRRPHRDHAKRHCSLKALSWAPKCRRGRRRRRFSRRRGRSGFLAHPKVAGCVAQQGQPLLAVLILLQTEPAENANGLSAESSSSHSQASDRRVEQRGGELAPAAAASANDCLVCAIDLMATPL